MCNGEWNKNNLNNFFTSALSKRMLTLSFNPHSNLKLKIAFLVRNL